MNKLAYGVGFNDRKYPAYISKKHVKEYGFWLGMLERCYSPLFLSKWPTYIGCEASNNFKNYSYFYEWCQEQVGFDAEGWHLDKDLLYRGNKIYGEDTCVFVPPELNTLLLTGKIKKVLDSDGFLLPVGVVWHSSQHNYHASMKVDNKKVHLGVFKKWEDAFKCYKENKERHVKLKAEEWKHLVDVRVYNALINYKV